MMCYSIDRRLTEKEASIVLSIEDLERDHKRFDDRVLRDYRPLWDHLIKRDVDEALANELQQEYDDGSTVRRVLIVLRQNKPRAGRKHREKRRAIEEKVAKTFVENSKRDLQELNAELAGMYPRTSIIVAATSLLFAIFALKPSAGKGLWADIGANFMAVAILINAIAFVIAIMPLRPPFLRAWRIPYNRRAYQTTVAVSDFEQWAMNCWFSERRTPIITKYKKSHAVAVPLAVCAAILAIPGIGLGVIFR